MDTMSYIMIVLGAATATRWFMELIEWMDKPEKRREG